jgi:hypothetical protein
MAILVDHCTVSESKPTMSVHSERCIENMRSTIVKYLLSPANSKYESTTFMVAVLEDYSIL